MTEPFNSPERDVTPQRVVLSRRRWLALAGAGTAVAGLGGAGLWWTYFRPGSDREVLAGEQDEAPGGRLYPARLDPRFADAGRPLTGEADAARYTNFYEF